MTANPSPPDPTTEHPNTEPLSDEDSLLLATAIAQWLRDLPAEDASDPAPIDEAAA